MPARAPIGVELPSEQLLRLVRRAGASLRSPVTRLFVLTFVGAKAATFFSPLFLSRLVSETNYSVFEYALNVAALAASVGGLGIAAAVPYYLVRRPQLEMRRVFTAHQYAGVLIAGSGVALILGSEDYWTLGLGLAFCGSLITQGIGTSLSRTEDRVIEALLTEAGLYLGLTLSLGLVVVEVPFRIALGVALACLLAAHARSVWHGRPTRVFGAGLSRLYKESFRYGFPIVIAGFLTTALTSSGRLLVRSFVGMPEVAAYSQCFRIAGALVLLYQFIGTAFFIHIYQAKASTLDVAYSALLAIFFVGAACVTLLAPVLVAPILPLFAGAIRAHPSLLRLLSVQVCLWIASALNETLIYREELATRSNLLAAACITLLVGGCALLQRYGVLGLQGVVYCNIVALFVFVNGQYHLLHSRGQRYPFARTVLSTGVGLFLVAEAFIRAR